LRKCNFPKFESGSPTANPQKLKMSQPNKDTAIYNESAPEANPNLLSNFYLITPKDDPANYGDESQESAEEYYSEEMDEDETRMYEAMNETTFPEFAKQAADLRKQGLFDEACHILKLIIQKGCSIYEDELSYKMALYYYQMGNLLIFFDFLGSDC
jgi:hypothetical protein